MEASDPLDAETDEGPEEWDESSETWTDVRPVYDRRAVARLGASAFDVNCRARAGGCLGMVVGFFLGAFVGGAIGGVAPLLTIPLGVLVGAAVGARMVLGMMAK